MLALFSILILVPILPLLLVQHKPRIGKLVAKRECTVGGKRQTKEQLLFKDPVECIRRYNQMVFELVKQSDSQGYTHDSWSANRFAIGGREVEIFRYGNQIEVVEMEIMIGQ
jgi:hypothetical protein